jgi:hypothetical protein
VSIGQSGMLERLGAIDGVSVSASDPGAGEKTDRNEVVDDRLGGAFGDADSIGEVADADVGVLGDRDQGFAVVAE